MPQTVLATRQYNDNASDSWVYGDGSDGDVVLSSGTTTISRDMYYNNLTIGATATLRTGNNAYRVFVRGLLSLDGLMVNRPLSNGLSGASTAGTIAGKNGGASTNFSTSEPGEAVWPAYAGVGGTAGDQLTPLVTGAASNIPATVAPADDAIHTVLGALRPALLSTGQLIGGGGGGSSAASPSSSGRGGAGGGVIVVMAARISGVGTIRANGANGTIGGGGGGGGGLIVVISQNETIGTITAGIGVMGNGVTINVAGGLGGGSDGNHNAGSDGTAGYIQVLRTRD
jgi:hypothetical protein